MKIKYLEKVTTPSLETLNTIGRGNTRYPLRVLSSYLYRLITTFLGRVATTYMGNTMYL